MAMTKPKRKLTGDPTSVWGEGMPDWLSGLIGDDEGRREQLMGWMGNAFASWTEGQKIKNAGMFKEVAGGHYMSQRQKEELLNPEDKATRLRRLQFHGGFIEDGNGGKRWTNNFDEYQAGTPVHVSTKSFGPGRKPAVPKALKNWVKDDTIPGRWSSGTRDYRSVQTRQDGGVDISFGAPGIERRRMAQERTDRALTRIEKGEELDRKGEELMRLADELRSRKPSEEAEGAGSSEPSSSDDPTKRPISAAVRGGDFMGRAGYAANPPGFSDAPAFTERSAVAARDFLAGLFGADRGGQTMRERGWLDIALGGAPVRQVVRGGKAR